MIRKLDAWKEVKKIREAERNVVNKGESLSVAKIFEWLKQFKALSINSVCLCLRRFIIWSYKIKNGKQLPLVGVLLLLIIFKSSGKARRVEVQIYLILSIYGKIFFGFFWLTQYKIG